MPDHRKNPEWMRQHLQRISHANPDSATLWFPRIAAIDRMPVRVPRTVMVPYDHHAAEEGLDAEFNSYEEPAYKPPLVELTAACEQIGHPCFLRTDLASAKHDGPTSYKISSPDMIARRFWRTVEDNACKLMFETPLAMMVREWLELAAPFVAFEGHPIAREWRFFVGPDGVMCSHFYWPHEAMHFHGCAEPDGWREALTELGRPLEVRERVLLSLAARRAQEALADVHPSWSIDFAQGKQGEWWLIDAAGYERSWHPECPNQPEEVRKAMNSEVLDAAAMLEDKP